MLDMQTIGRRLKELRGDRSREEIAIAVGVTAQAICNYECGIRTPSDDVKVKLARVFETTVQAIFYD